MSNISDSLNDKVDWIGGCQVAELFNDFLWIAVVLILILQNIYYSTCQFFSIESNPVRQIYNSISLKPN